MIRRGLAEAEQANGPGKSEILNELASEVENRAGRSSNGDKVRKLAAAVKDLAASS
jgi:hypothetical protein